MYRLVMAPYSLNENLALKDSLVSEQHHEIIEEIAPAKLNLSLHVIGQRSDNYHLLQSLVVFMNNGDMIKVQAADSDSFAISGRFGGGEDFGADNLVVKARNFLRDLIGQERCPPVAIHLEKNLPIASGIGGGSSDAAATLVALIRHWNLIPDADDREAELQLLTNKVQSLGADVPMCLHGVLYRSPLIATGIGEILKPLDEFIPLDILLINSGVAVSTPQIFAKLENKNNLEFSWTDGAGAQYKGLIEKLKTMRNDLYQPALHQYPALKTILHTLQDLGADFAAMSGSGATCFGIFPNAQALQQAYLEAQKIYPNYFLMAGKSYGV